RQHAAPAGDAERVGGFALRTGDQVQHLLSAARDQRHLDDRQRDPGRQPRLLLGRFDDQDVHEDGDDDRRQAVHDVHQELHGADAAASGVLAEEEGDEDADRHRDQGADADDDSGADQVRADPVRFALGDEVPADRLDAVVDDGPDDDHQYRHGGYRGGDGEPLGDPAGRMPATQVAGRHERLGRVEGLLLAA